MKMEAFSNIQRQFFIDTSLREVSSAYTIASLVRIEGRFDETRMQDAWRIVFEAAPLLRSHVVYSEGEPHLAEADGCVPSFKAIECADRDPRQVAREIAGRSIKLAEAPLARFFVLRAGAELNYALLVQHHIVTDLFSKTTLAALLAKAYDDPKYRPEIIPYSSFAQAEAAFLDGDKGRAARDYWEGKMPNVSPLELPHRSYRTQAFKGQGLSCPWRLPEPLSKALGSSEKRGKAHFLVLLAVYACLLYRLSGQRRFLIGVPLTNRLLVGDGPLIGPCVNILPVAIEIDGSSAFEDVYNSIRRELLLNNRHQAYPFLKIAESYSGERDPMRPRLLQAGFTNEPLFNLDLEGLDCSPVYLPREGAQMDLFITWWKRGDSWEGYWEYNTGSFGEDEILRWQDYYARILAVALDDPAAAIGRIELLDGHAARALTGEGSSVDYPLKRSMADLLRESFAAHPAETALVYEGVSVSYAEMEEKVEAVASFICGSAGSGGRVAVILRRSPEMLYALHGIVRSGNAYVPIGIDWPDERVLDILGDIRPVLVLGGEEHRQRIASSGVALHTIEEILSDPARGAGPAAISIDPVDPMYIMYTSGTTGRPKGAVLPHRGIVNRLFWMQDAYRLAPGERVLLKTPYTFDVSVWELFWPFLAGATLVVSRESQQRDPRELLGLIERESVGVMHFVPSMLAHFLSQDGLERARSLRDVICSGEALSPDLVGRFYDALPWAALHNLYGPTEASIDVTYWDCSREDVARGVVPIGYPIANTQMYVIDQDGSLCPPYVKGEICIGGVGLADGYWEREELTKAKFVANPLGEGRVYRTGDLGRYEADGAIEYLERMDNQVKVRGIRVELDEIEARLRALDGVREALVKKGRYQTGEECLIAYYLSADGRDLDAESARLALRAYLPEAMVPGVFVRKDSFPVGENGKLDRKAFPEIAPVLRAQRPPDYAPGDRVQAGVSSAWAAFLGGEAIPPDRNFFDAGGNSLSLLSLRASLEKEFGVELQLLDLFQSPTIEGMASLIKDRGEGGSAADGEGEGDAALRARKQRMSLQRMQRRGGHE